MIRSWDFWPFSLARQNCSEQYTRQPLLLHSWLQEKDGKKTRYLHLDGCWHISQVLHAVSRENVENRGIYSGLLSPCALLIIIIMTILSDPTNSRQEPKSPISFALGCEGGNIRKQKHPKKDILLKSSFCASLTELGTKLKCRLFSFFPPFQSHSLHQKQTNKQTRKNVSCTWP